MDNIVIYVVYLDIQSHDPNLLFIYNNILCCLALDCLISLIQSVKMMQHINNLPNHNLKYTFV